MRPPSDWPLSVSVGHFLGPFFKKKKDSFYFITMHEYLHVMYVTARPGEKAGTAVTNDCGLSHACWEPKPGPLREQQKFLTTEPFLKPCEGGWGISSLVINVGESSVL